MPTSQGMVSVFKQLVLHGYGGLLSVRLRQTLQRRRAGCWGSLYQSMVDGGDEVTHINPRVSEVSAQVWLGKHTWPVKKSGVI